MKKNKLIFEITLFTTLLFVCTASGCKKKIKEAEELKLSDNAYLAESSSGDILINFDEEGNPVELIDANGTVTDLTNEEVSVVKDKKSGEIKSVTVGEKTIALKEKATEKNSEKILAKANEEQEKKETQKEVKKEETKTSEKKEESSSEKISEEPKKEEEQKKSFTPGVDAPELPSEKPKTPKTSEKASEEQKVEPVVSYTEEAASGSLYGAFYGTSNSQLIYKMAGTEYEAAKDPKTGSDAYLVGANEAWLLGKTSNGWYHIKTYTSYGPVFSERVEGYVPASSLVDEGTKNKMVEDYNKKLAEEQKKQEKKEKTSEKPSENPSEIPSETPSEKPSEKPSDTPSEQPPTPPTSEEMKKIEEEQKKKAEEQNNKQYTITASANQGIFNQINAWRVENGLAELTWGSDNEGICSTRATEQTDHNYNLQGSLDHGYGTPWSGAENLSDRGTGAVFDGWKSSGGHNQTMLGDYTYCVVYTGYADGLDGVTVALFW